MLDPFSSHLSLLLYGCLHATNTMCHRTTPRFGTISRYPFRSMQLLLDGPECRFLTFGLVDDACLKAGEQIKRPAQGPHPAVRDVVHRLFGLFVGHLQTRETCTYCCGRATQYKNAQKKLPTTTVPLQKGHFPLVPIAIPVVLLCSLRAFDRWLRGEKQQPNTDYFCRKGSAPASYATLALSQSRFTQSHTHLWGAFSLSHLDVVDLLLRPYPVGHGPFLLPLGAAYTRRCQAKGMLIRRCAEVYLAPQVGAGRGREGMEGRRRWR